MAGNVNLVAARAAKKDEFYTQWNDIENEMQAYLEYDPDVFRGKTVLLPCDDPEWSNFTKYFALNFEKFGLKKLTSTSCAPRFNPAADKRGRIYVLERGEDASEDGCLSEEYLKWDYLEGDGDFRSEEVTKLRDEADVIVTNPPYSLFREFIPWMIDGDVEFAVIGSMNAVTYREVFPLIKEGKVWLGRGRSRWFEVPAIYPESKSEKFTKEGSRIIPVYSNWFTNIQHGRKNEPLKLKTMEGNLLHGSKRVREAAYVKYDNYDAIEVPEVKGIPSDYPGVMGVPISFLDKYNPDQFEILGCANYTGPYGSDHLGVGRIGKEWMAKYREAGGRGRYAESMTNLVYYSTDGVAKYPFSRILIRHRNPEREESQPLSQSRSGQSSLRCKRGLSHVEVRG